MVLSVVKTPSSQLTLVDSWQLLALGEMVLGAVGHDLLLWNNFTLLVNEPIDVARRPLHSIRREVPCAGLPDHLHGLIDNPW
jgi:hypothetical protein